MLKSFAIASWISGHDFDDARVKQEADRKRQEKVQISAILKRIGDRDTSQAGIDELFRFKQQHPDADLNTYYALMSSEFRMYLQRGLEKAARRASRRSSLVLQWLWLIRHTSAVLQHVQSAGAMLCKCPQAA